MRELVSKLKSSCELLVIKNLLIAYTTLFIQFYSYAQSKKATKSFKIFKIIDLVILKYKKLRNNSLLYLKF